MAKKGSKTTSKTVNKTIPSFCYCCGTPVESGQDKCSNSQCHSHDTGTTFAPSTTTYCVWCKEYVGIDMKTKQCLGCHHKVHGAIVNCHKHAFH